MCNILSACELYRVWNEDWPKSMLMFICSSLLFCVIRRFAPKSNFQPQTSQLPIFWADSNNLNKYKCEIPIIFQCSGWETFWLQVTKKTGKIQHCKIQGYKMCDFCLNVDRGTYAEQVAKNLGKHENSQLLFRALCGIHISAQHTPTTFRTWQINEINRLITLLGLKTD